MRESSDDAAMTTRSFVDVSPPLRGMLSEVKRVEPEVSDVRIRPSNPEEYIP